MNNYGFVKCAVATINGKIANPMYNAEKIKALIDKAISKEVQILVLPELSLTGYTCQDLFSMSELLESSLTALKMICSYTQTSFYKTRSPLVLVGCPIIVNDCLYNCAVAIQGGNILGVVPKQYIPNSNESYEKRWFTPYTDFSCTEVDIFGNGNKVPFGNLIFSSSIGYKLGIEIGQDLYSTIPPSSYLSLAGANIIANLSASNELVGKNIYRKELIKNQSSRTISAYLYVSANCLSESTSDLVFSGSGFIFENGKELSSLDSLTFEEQMKVIDVDIDYISNQRLNNTTFSDSKKELTHTFTTVNFLQDAPLAPSITRDLDPHPFIPNIMSESGGASCKETISMQSIGLAKRLKTINIKKVTIGVSGGLDSTLALLVCYEAFSKLGLDPKGIIGITMPGFGTTDRTFSNSVQLAQKLGITLLEIPIRDACLQHFKDIQQDSNVHDITYENSQARERTQILMDMANKHQGLVVGTGDLSEIALGWCTYNGDDSSMYNPNCSIPKTLVKYLIEWYARFNCSDDELKKVLLDIIDTPISPELLPSDGKKVVQKTETTVGPYEVIDFCLFNFLQNKFSPKKIYFLLTKAFENVYTKEELRRYYNNFATRFFNNQFKRNTSPDGPKIGNVSLSPRGDWRMPSDSDNKIWLLK